MRSISPPKPQPVNLFAAALVVLAVAMLFPAVIGLVSGWVEAVRAFGFSALLTAVLAALIALATRGDETVRKSGRSRLGVLLMIYLLLPLPAMLPFFELVPDLTGSEAYFEALSALTTTGATLVPENVPDAVHLWRATMGWLGGFMALLAALAIMAPLNLGGFEVRFASGGRESRLPDAGPGVRIDPDAQLWRHARTVAPLYVAATLALGIGLTALGDSGLVAAIHAMSILSTSGISGIGGLQNAPSGVAGEVLVFVFLGLALSHRAFTDQWGRNGLRRMGRDVELRIALFIILAAVLPLFLRHYIVVASDESGTMAASPAMLSALWGMIFGALSFLTTTGFESRLWAESIAWTGLHDTEMLFLTLALIGGGVATTAGGIKLLRIFALYKHGAREMERLVHPSSVGGYGIHARSIRREGAYIAWMCAMLFFLALGLGMFTLGVEGVPFEHALMLSAAMLTNCGPLIEQVVGTDLSLEGLGPLMLAGLDGLMILGRFETLAMVALLNPEYWRK